MAEGDPIELILSAINDLKSSNAYAQAALDAYALGEAFRLAGRVSESGSVISGQTQTPYTTTTSTTIQAQTGDVEVIEGVFLNVTDLPSGDTVAAELQLTDTITIPFTFTSTAPQFLFSPVSIPVQNTKRTLTVVSASGTYGSVTAIMWGHVAPARTLAVH